MRRNVKRFGPHRMGGKGKARKFSGGFMHRGGKKRK